MDVQMPDGTVIQGVPDGITKSQLLEKYGKLQGADLSAEQPVTPPAAPQNDSFLSEMGNNFSHGIESARDLFTGNVQDIGHTSATPKTEALAEKLFPPGSSGGYVDAINNALRNTSASDWSGALLEKFGESPEGKAMAALGGLHPVFNAASTAVNRYVNPAIQKGAAAVENFANTPAGRDAAMLLGIGPIMQGIGMMKNPDNLALAEMVAGTGGLKKAATVSDPLASAVKGVRGEAKAPPAAEVRATAGQTYQAAEQAGGILKPHLTDAWIDTSSKVMPQTSAGKLIRGDTEATQLVNRMQGLRGKPLTLQEAMEIYSELGDLAEKHVNPKDGKLLAEGERFSQIQDALWDTMDNASPADIVGGKQGFDLWKQGKQDWAKSIRMSDMERIIQRANNSDNPATVMKNGFNTMLSNPKRMRGLSKAEVSAVKHAARHGVLIGPLKFIGSRLISTMTGLGTGMFGGGPVGATAGAAAGAMLGTIPRAAANAMQRGRAQKAINTVYNGPKPKIPLNQQMKNNAKRIGNASQDAVFGASITAEERRKVRP